MRSLILSLAVVAGTCYAPIITYSADAPGNKLPLSILYLGSQQDQQRSDAFVEYLSSRFTRCLGVTRDGFHREMLTDIDVVILDWSQRERRSKKYESPLGSVESWETPTVLLGSAGHLIAGPWSVIGGSG